jgi:hypothetical protein
MCVLKKGKRYMKKIILFLLSLLGPYVLHGMEKEQMHIMRVVEFATNPKICVVQDSMYNTSPNRADILVLGAVEQKKMLDVKVGSYGHVGDVTCFDNDNVPVKSNSRDFLDGKEKKKSALLDSIKSKKKKNECQSLEIKKVDNILLYVVEPHSLFKDINYTNTTAENDKAWQEAQKGLGTCYMNTLEKAYEFFTENNETRSIALPLLSVSSGFPVIRAIPEAVASVLEFIKNSPHKDKYKLIEFVVGNDTDFILYWEVLEKQNIRFYGYHDSGVPLKQDKKS